MSTTELLHPPSNYIGGRFITIAGDALVSDNPSDPAHVLWRGSPNIAHVDDAVNAAQRACSQWAKTSFEDRAEFLRKWAAVTTSNVERIAGLITDEMGKTLAESTFEAKALAEKVTLTLDRTSLNRVSEYEVAVSNTRAGLCRFKPHGVMAVIGPFNFPAHLANGHFVPALLMGNTIVFKPSDKTPAVGQLIVELMHEIGLPPGVFNVVQGGADIASKLVNLESIDGILFTGSWPVGRRILEANLDRPGRIIALEMGGNNPSVVMNDAHLKQAVIENARSAFATTGQRCTCTRRIIVQRAIADQFIAAFCKTASTMLIGPGRSTTPVFMGPLINAGAVDSVLDAQANFAKQGSRILLQAARMDREGGAFMTPGVVQVDGFTLDRDREIFGPFAQISVVDELDEAIAQANATNFGLAASIFTTNNPAYEHFFHHCKAGCINLNTGTAGASSKLPFGGVKQSGNHRPAGAFAIDACAYPIANMIEKSANVALPGGMQWDDRWA